MANSNGNTLVGTMQNALDNAVKGHWMADTLASEMQRLGIPEGSKTAFLKLYPTGKPAVYKSEDLATLGAKPTGNGSTAVKVNGNGKGKNGNGVSGTPTLEQAMARIAELEALQSTGQRAISLKVSTIGAVNATSGNVGKGTLMMNGIRRLPLAYYPEEWLKILDASDAVRDFIKAHHREMNWKRTCAICGSTDNHGRGFE